MMSFMVIMESLLRIVVSYSPLTFIFTVIFPTDTMGVDYFTS